MEAIGLPAWNSAENNEYALITGANSGFGYSLAARLVDEFLSTSISSPGKHLTLILCTRSQFKTQATISRLRLHILKLTQYPQAPRQFESQAKVAGENSRWQDPAQRIHLLGVEADLCNLKSIYALADRLVNGTLFPDSRDEQLSYGFTEIDASRAQCHTKKNEEQRMEGGNQSIRIPRIDILFLTAGIGGWSGINWISAMKDMCLDVVEAVTWPKYKIAKVGALARPQLESTKRKGLDDGARLPQPMQASLEEPALGEVFCANVFGHYILAHELMPLLSRPATASCKSSSKIIWISSIQASDEDFSIDDLQAVRSATPYESSKRLIDLLVLTSELPSVHPLVTSFFDSANTVTRRSNTERPGAEEDVVIIRPKNYLAHPGVFASDIMPLNFLLVLFGKFVLYLVRWLGSPWHTIQPYKAAVAPVWLATTCAEALDQLEEGGLCKVKWGSATDTCGRERPKQTEVSGWGWDGRVGALPDAEQLRGRQRGATYLCREQKESFENLGRQCWLNMEGLRREWESVLGLYSPT
ncbi:BgTH12-05531 [Blumeria graminis f. sp. triticale]|uniref:BgTH12-05531 n=1 Tax=Blumeria graminis f. sp. triticale TaxID=1689686 RepID=A0A9W4DP98_BLUGR|nr:BgTH12-05531 [Blumeria graminis f. sp. triticale]